MYGELPGPHVDVARFEGFLRSAHGGAWEAGEIISLEGPQERQLNRAIGSTRGADFSMVVFAGHGGTVENQGMFVCLGDGFVRELRAIFTHAAKQLLIVDACRSPTAGSLAGAIKIGADTGAVEDRTYRYSCRQLYETKVARAAETMVVLFSCASGENAADGKDGGLFSRKFLDLCQSESDSSTVVRPFGMASESRDVRQMFPRVANAVNRAERGQHPQIWPPRPAQPSLPLVVW
jgi:hypothetical protein